MKSGLGKIFLKFLHALTMSFLLLNFDQKYKFSNKKKAIYTSAAYLSNAAFIAFVCTSTSKSNRPNAIFWPLVLMTCQ